MIDPKMNRGQEKGVFILMSFLTLVVCIRLLTNYLISTGDIDEQMMGVNLEIELKEFDPNSATLKEFMQLGLHKDLGVNIIRYREYGKVFRIKEDLYTCNGMTDSIYYILEPYIKIADSLKPKPKEWTKQLPRREEKRVEEKAFEPLVPFMMDTVGVDFLVSVGALTKRQAEVVVKWRNISPIRSIGELRECYVVSDSVATLLEPYIIFTPEVQEEEEELVNLNTADSLQLRKVYGIGEKSAVAILEYRQKLGGFYSANQLSELKVITESNFDKILQQILCDSCDISKIDVNFAPAKKMSGHPYLPPRVLRRLLKVRELKGGWSTIEEMITDDILNEEEATRLRPYLNFRLGESEVSEEEFF